MVMATSHSRGRVQDVGVSLLGWRTCIVSVGCSLAASIKKVSFAAAFDVPVSEGPSRSDPSKGYSLCWGSASSSKSCFPSISTTELNGPSSPSLFYPSLNLTSLCWNVSAKVLTHGLGVMMGSPWDFCGVFKWSVAVVALQDASKPFV